VIRERPEAWRAEYGEWPPFSFSAFLDQAPERFPEMRVIDDTGAIGFGELVERARRCAGGLEAWGVRPGDKVALWAENRLEWLEAWFAIAWVGAVIVPVNTRLSRDEIDYVLDRSDAAWAIVSPAGAATAERFTERRAEGSLRGLARIGDDAGDVRFDHLRDAEPIPSREQPGQVGMILFTSGSTAFPKGVLLPNGCLIWNGFAVGRSWLVTVADTMLVANPLFHNGGAVFNFLAAATHGARTRLMRKWEMPRGADVIAEEGVSLFLRAREGRAWPSLRVIAMAGDEALTARIGPELGAEPSGVYGLTECTTNVALGDLREPREVRERHIGRPQAGLEVRIVDPVTLAVLPPETVGEITVRGWTVMEGYYRDEAATAAAFTDDGFVRTGDLGTLSADGYLRFRGRLKLMMKSGGENVSLEEVENVLREHPAVADVVVVPVPDARFAEVGWALLVLADEAATVADVEAFARRQLANFKVPKRFFVLPELPRTGSGKVDRPGLRRRYVEGATT
jgi:fatty-acyl-CoA synthase